jgi:tRNA U34 5-carboxymethylaminomethyl modifying GTPase MnmE/TrmE
MKGSLKNYIEEIRDEIIHILAYSEVSIDYAESKDPEVIKLKSDEIIIKTLRTIKL